MVTQSTSEAVPVLLTRPEPEASIYAGILTAQFPGRVRPVVAPLMAVEYLRPDLPAGPFSAVIFTSAAGVAAAQRLKADLPRAAWCVGRNTAARADAAGFAAQTAGGDADALIAAILAAPQQGRLLHLRGEDTRGDVAERLISAGIETESAIVYRQVPQPLSAEATELVRRPGVVIVPLFSPRSAWLLGRALPPDRLAELRVVCMSRAVAEAAAGISDDLQVAERPDARAMTEAVGRVLT